MRRAYLDVMTESQYRQLLAEHEAFQASLGELPEDWEFGADVAVLSDEQIDELCTEAVRRGA